ncbi:response regulator transcription factor [uncultured Sphingomonas sp.]|uniref:response regulator transcription factor n=1 Tax=uncultured Sphingomonas sp. TaxID=158754 RepID=UPI0025E58416|nr:response regulator transcription factor [uncultured Sphingomonas sp.]
MTGSIAVAIVEDDADLRAVLTRFLDGTGMTVASFENVRELDAALQTQQFDVLILDVNLPDESGFVAAARLRARSSVGIVMLTGRTDQQDRLLGLSIGADHYLGKPVDLRELESVIRNLARRLQAVPAAPPAPATPQAGTPAPADGQDQDGTWLLDCDAWRLTSPNGMGVELSAAEYQVLLPLLEQPGRLGSRDMINARLGKPRLDPQNRSLDVLISRTRRKIDATTGMSLPLRSARGTGYVFTGLSKIKGSAE